MSMSGISKLRRALLAAALVLCGPSAPALAAGAAYPTHEIRFVVPWNPGGGADITMRVLAKLVDADGLRLVLENVPGASGAIGLARVAAAAPDGYTLGFATSSQLALVAQGLTKTRNDQFTYLNQTSYDQFLLLVDKDSPAHTPDEFIALMKRNPGKISIGTAGGNNVPHILAATTAGLAGVNFIHVPYTGASKAVSDLAGKQIQAAVLRQSESRAMTDGGMIRPIATYGDQRLGGLPNVPTFTERGYNIYPNGRLVSTTWLVGPAGMPADVTEKLIRIFGKAIRSDEFKKFSDENGYGVGDTEGDSLRRQVLESQETLNKVAPLFFTSTPQ